MKAVVFSKHLFSLLFIFGTMNLAAETYAPWLTQIGLTENVASAAKWGRGVKLGVVDTGIYASSPFFSKGQVSNSRSSCAALSFTCSDKYNDDHGHGTAVAAIASGSYLFGAESNYGGYTVSTNSISSTAPSANIIAQKVLNASGIGYSLDVANGIIKAADAGASVINLSLTFINSPDIVASINYAASKGAVIVWAGGNSAANLLSNSNTSGLTDAALNRLVFAGSVDSNNAISTFSNTPGSGNLISTNNNTSYAQRWLMAPGENILSAYNPAEPRAWGYWSGTSMSTPLISGSLVLLQAAWPILKTQGTAVDLLLATATDLGETGPDNIYGKGMVNLTKAFAPYGELSIKNSKNSTTYLVSELNSAMITSGALGKLSKVKSKLANYTAFDEYQRNYKVNLSGIIQTNQTQAILNPLPVNKRTKASAFKLIDGATVHAWTQLPTIAFDHLGEFGFNPDHPQPKQPIYFALDTVNGSTFAFADGFASQYAYANALYGNSEFALLSSGLSTQSMTQLAEGGKMLSYGTHISSNSRLAFSWSNPSTGDSNRDEAQSSTEINLFKVGISHQLSSKAFAGVSANYLTEKNGLVGSRYTANNSLGFNPNNQSYGLDFSFGYRLDEDHMILLEKGFSLTKSAKGDNFIIHKTSSIESQSLGFSALSKNVFANNDTLKVSISQPLTVTSGKAYMNITSVDAFGYPVYENEAVDISPTGRETRLNLVYEKNLFENQSLKFDTNFVKDTLNISGKNDASVTLLYELYF